MRTQTRTRQRLSLTVTKVIFFTLVTVKLNINIYQHKLCHNLINNPLNHHVSKRQRDCYHYRT